MAAPVERKVQASTAGAAVSSLALWALSRYVFKGDVPDVVTSWVYVIVASGLTFAAGYLAKHTVLPGEPPPAAVPPGAPASKPPMTSLPPAATVQDRPEPSEAPAVTSDNAKAAT